MTNHLTSALPFKSAASALLFSVILGPVGLLYSSVLGGMVMIPVGVLVICSGFYFPIALVWLLSCIWSAKSVESYNRNLLNFYFNNKL